MLVWEESHGGGVLSLDRFRVETVFSRVEKGRESRILYSDIY